MERRHAPSTICRIPQCLTCDSPADDGETVGEITITKAERQVIRKEGFAIGAQASFFLTFQETECCCCQDGNYRWIQTVLHDNTPGFPPVPYNDPTEPDGSREDSLDYYYMNPQLPRYYKGRSTGNCDAQLKFEDTAGREVRHFIGRDAPKSISLIYQLDLVCASEGDKVLWTKRWGFTIIAHDLGKGIIDLTTSTDLPKLP